MGAAIDCSYDKGQPFPDSNTHREREVSSETETSVARGTSSVVESARDYGSVKEDEVKDAEAEVQMLLKLDTDAADVGEEICLLKPAIYADSSTLDAMTPEPSEFQMSLPSTTLPIAEESDDEIESDESDESESEEDNGTEMMIQQIGHLLHRHTTAAYAEPASVDSYTSVISLSGLYPPLADATFECEVKVLILNAEVMEGIKMMDPTSGGTSTLARRRRSGKVMSAVRKRRRGDLLRRRGVSVSAVYSRNGVDTMHITGKCDSREFDANIVDIRESFAFALHTDAGEHVVGRISFEAKESHGTFAVTKTLCFGSIKLKEGIEEGIISRRGDWTEINMPLFEIHKSKFKALKKKLRKSGKKAPQRPVEVGTLQLRCRLHWTEEVVAAFEKQVSVRRHGESTTLRRKEMSVKKDLFYLLTHRCTTLRLTVLAVLFDVEALGEWDTDDTVRLIRELRETGTHSTVFADAIEDTLVSGTYQCRDRLRTKRTPAHSSKNADVLFIGETLAFKLKPFAPELADAREADAGGDWHPQVRFQRDEATKQPPGSVQLAVDRKSQRIGAALFLLRDMLPHAAVADSLASNKHLFVLPVFQWLPAAQCLADAVQTKVALMFCIGQFLWDEQ